MSITTQQPEPLFEEQVRQLRDQVFRSTLNDNSWEMCKTNWLRPDSVEWLKKKSQIDLK